MERCRKGDLEAFSEIVVRLHDEVRGFIAMMAVAPDWTDDVEQEIFIEVYRTLDRFEKDRSFPKWVRGIARNVVRRHAERRSRDSKLRQDAVSQMLRERRQRVSQAAEEPEGPPGLLAALRRCFERLPEHVRALLKLRYQDQKTPAEIAQETQRQAVAVRVSLLRVRRALSECVQAEAGREGISI